MQSDKESLIEFLISKGEIPSFSFPLDTTMFAAESKSRKRLAHVARYSRDTKLALSELAPGQIRTVDGKRMKIGGLYFEYSRDRVNRAREFFDWFFTLQENKVSMCLNDFCSWVSDNKRDDLSNEACPVCLGSSDPLRNPNNVRTYRLLQPEGFAPICVPHDNGKPVRNMSTGKADFVGPVFQKSVTKKGSRFSGRARLPAPDAHDLAQRDAVWTGGAPWNRVSLYTSNEQQEGFGTEFVLVNTGPGEEGFTFCEQCGSSMHSEHIEKVSGRDAGLNHFRPYIVQGQDISPQASGDERRAIHRGCSGLTVPSEADMPIGLGLRFRTDLALFRFDLSHADEPLAWMTPQFHGAMCAIRDAIQTTFVKKMGLMNREIGAGYRRVVNNDGKRFVDVYLFDSVSGGAGLVTQIEQFVPHMEAALDDALEHLDGRSCLEGRACSRACVGCLLDFKNRIDHDTINRPLGWSLFRFFATNRSPKGHDFGMHESQEINRVQLAVDAYAAFYGDANAVKLEEDGTVTTATGASWNVISPLFKEDIETRKIRADTFEFFPDVIVGDLSNPDQRASIFDL
jgi:hypothetical protein